jgi:hypothetical protein
VIHRWLKLAHLRLEFVLITLFHCEGVQQGDRYPTLRNRELTQLT